MTGRMCGINKERIIAELAKHGMGPQRHNPVSNKSKIQQKPKPRKKRKRQ